MSKLFAAGCFCTKKRTHMVRFVIRCRLYAKQIGMCPCCRGGQDQRVFVDLIH